MRSFIVVAISLLVLQSICPRGSHNVQCKEQPPPQVQRPTADKLESHLMRLVRASDEVPQPDLSWRWRYFDEQKPNGKIEVFDTSLDTRLSDISAILNTVTASFVDIYELFQFDTPTEELERLAAKFNYSERDNEECGQYLKLMLDTLDELKKLVRDKRDLIRNRDTKLDASHLLLAQVLDSFGKPESGLLSGKDVFLGHYKQCEDTRLLFNLDQPNNVKHTSMRYCVAKMRLDDHLNPQLRHMKKLWLYPENQLSVGVCLPRACHTLSFRMHRALIQKLVDTQFRLPKDLFINETLPVDKLYCLIDETSPLRSIPVSGRIGILVVLAWFTLLAVATFFWKSDMLKKEKLCIVRKYINQALEAVDLKKSWQDFSNGGSNTLPDTSRIDLDVLNPIKVVACMLVVFGHVLLLEMVMAMDYYKAQAQLEDDPMFYTIISSTLIVDTFFVISGMLTSYLAMRKFKKQLTSSNKGSAWFFTKQSFQLAAYRYSRLVPLYLVVHWFTRSVYIYLGAGPRWDYGYNQRSLVGKCRMEQWWTPFTPMSAYRSLAEQCLPQTWSIAGDLFCGIVLAPVVVLFSRRPKIALGISAVLAVVSNMAMLVAFSQIDAGVKLELRSLKWYSFMQLFLEYSEIYVGAHFRIFSVLMGVVAGYFLFLYSEKKPGNEWPEWFKGLATSFSLGTIILTAGLSSCLYFYRDYLRVNPVPEIFVIHAMSSSRFMWSFANATVFMRMMTDWKDSPVLRFTKRRFWRVLVRLNYPILLLHIVLVINDMQMQVAMRNYSYHEVMIMFSYVYLFSSIIGVFLHVVFENPLDKLIKSLFFEQLAPKNETEREDETAMELTNTKTTNGC